MKLLDVFHADSLRALGATRTRKALTSVSSIVFIAASFYFGGAVAPWVWLVAVGLDMVVWLFIGNHWAIKDARRLLDS